MTIAPHDDPWHIISPAQGARPLDVAQHGHRTGIFLESLDSGDVWVVSTWPSIAEMADRAKGDACDDECRC
ncbi:MAG: hypothetical protein O3A53_21030 [Acidobacteria bacterium]|nr:hypothetical protein [Acidobacteriota bacterium]